jgi:hypothetical protein
MTVCEVMLQRLVFKPVSTTTSQIASRQVVTLNRSSGWPDLRAVSTEFLTCSNAQAKEIASRMKCVVVRQMVEDVMPVTPAAGTFIAERMMR